MKNVHRGRGRGGGEDEEEVEVEGEEKTFEVEEVEVEEEETTFRGFNAQGLRMARAVRFRSRTVGASPTSVIRRGRGGGGGE